MFNLTFTPPAILGFLGGFFLGVSWIIQMLESLINKKSVVSLKFWLLRFAGALMLTLYAIAIKDLVFTLVNGGTTMIFMANIILHLKRK